MATRELKATVFYNSGELTYNFPFDYIKKRFVSIKYIDNFEADTLDAAENLEYGVDYTINDKVVTLKEAGDTSKYIYIYRSTPTEPLVDFSDSSFLTEENLDLSNLQQLHLNEEMSDYLILHKVPSGTLEEIRDAVESTTSAAESAEQASTEAIIAAKSINIKKFDSVIDMKNDTNIIVGSLVKTLGFYSYNDGGGAIYKIVDSVEEDVDEVYIIALQNNLYAKLIINNNILFIKQLGAKCDGITDDTDIVEKAFKFLYKNPSGILDLSGGIIAVSREITFPLTWSSTVQNGYFLALDTFEGECIIHIPYSFPEGETRPNSGYMVVDAINFTNIYFDCNYRCGAMLMDGFLKFNINKCNIWDYKGFGIKTAKEDAHEAIITDCTIFTTDRNEGDIGLVLTNPDNIVNNVIIKGGQYGVHVLNKYNMLTNIHVYGVRDYSIYLDKGASHNWVRGWYFDGHGIYSKVSYNISFIDCDFLEQRKDIFTIDLSEDATQYLDKIRFINCRTLQNTAPDTETIKLINIIGREGAQIFNDNIIDIMVQQAKNYIIDNRNLLGFDNNNQKGNSFIVPTNAPMYEFNSALDTILSQTYQKANKAEIAGMSIHYLGHSGIGYEWFGYELDLMPNTYYAYKDAFTDVTTNTSILVSDELPETENKSCTALIKGDNKPQWKVFFTGEHKHIFIACYRNSVQPIIIKLKNI